MRITGQPVESIQATHAAGNTERHWQTEQFLLPAQNGAEQKAGIAIDITRSVQADHLCEAIHERDEFVWVLAHEVRQPLNNASAALESAAAELAPGVLPCTHALVPANQRASGRG